MKDNVTITISSLLSIILTIFHITSDVVVGFEKPGPSILVIVPIVVGFLYGTLPLAGRRSGYIIILIGSLLGLYVPYLHMKGAHIGDVAKSSHGFFFIWTLLALAVTSLFSVILATHGLFRLERAKPR